MKLEYYKKKAGQKLPRFAVTWVFTLGKQGFEFKNILWFDYGSS